MRGSYVIRCNAPVYCPVSFVCVFVTNHRCFSFSSNKLQRRIFYNLLISEHFKVSLDSNNNGGGSQVSSLLFNFYQAAACRSSHAIPWVFFLCYSCAFLAFINEHILSFRYWRPALWVHSLRGSICAQVCGCFTDFNFTLVYEGCLVMQWSIISPR